MPWQRCCHRSSGRPAGRARSRGGREVDRDREEYAIRRGRILHRTVASRARDAAPSNGSLQDVRRRAMP
jgi:hypothetical protein